MTAWEQALRDSAVRLALGTTNGKISASKTHPICPAGAGGESVGCGDAGGDAAGGATGESEAVGRAGVMASASGVADAGAGDRGAVGEADAEGTGEGATGELLGKLLIVEQICTFTQRLACVLPCCLLRTFKIVPIGSVPMGWLTGVDAAEAVGVGSAAGGLEKRTGGLRRLVIRGSGDRDTCTSEPTSSVVSGVGLGLAAGGLLAVMGSEVSVPIRELTQAPNEGISR